MVVMVLVVNARAATPARAAVAVFIRANGRAANMGGIVADDGCESSASS